MPEASQSPPPSAAGLAGPMAEWLVRFRGPLFLLALVLAAACGALVAWVVRLGGGGV